MAGSTTPRRFLVRSAATAIVVSLAWVACTQDSADVTSPADQLAILQQQLVPAMAVQEKHTPDLMARPGVVGTAVSRSATGEPVVKIYTATADVTGLPDRLDGIAVEVEVTGEFFARQDPTQKFPRPVPTGVSTGHPDITAGTICCQVHDGLGNLFAMSNNHVYANENQADIGDPVIQPGSFDGGSVATDVIGNLFDFEPIQFCTSNGGGGRPGGGGGGTTCPDNVMDAAIAATDASLVGVSTPANGYGAPTSTPVPAVVGMSVKKYGRTTGLTFGQVSGINATVNVGYGPAGTARFVNQVVITPGSFSAGGDSGSLIVDDNDNPVALLFAGSSFSTIGNPIGPVLARFGVTVSTDGPPVADIAVTDLVGPGGFVLEGDVAQITATVANVSSVGVTDDIVVTLDDDTDGGQIGQQTIVGGLAAGGSTDLVFNWNTTGASLGGHDVTASHDFDDGSAGNNSATTVVTVLDEAPSNMHVGDLDGSSATEGRAWNATVVVTVHDDSQNGVANATVSGTWTGGGAGGAQCTTDATGTCTLVRTGLSLSQNSTVFSVTNVTHGVLTYDPSGNTDPDGDSDGTSITVNKPGSGGGGRG